MRKSEVTPLFQMSYADLMQLGDKADDLITRDLVELTPYGVDATFQSDLATMTQELKDFPTDEELQGDVSDLTETKDAAADAVKVDIRSIMVRAKNGFGESSAKYRRFGTKGMDDMTDNDLVKCGKRVVRTATLFLTQLASKGLTATMISDLNDKVTIFDDAIDAQDDAIRLRDTATEDRLELGNELYKKIVELFDFGKDYWVTRDEAKYNDYIIYEGGSSPGSNIKSGTINSGEVVNVLSPADAEFVIGANIRLKNATTNPAIGPLYYYMSGNPGDGWNGNGVALNPGQETTIAVDGGNFNPYLNIQNQGPNQQNWEVEIL